MAKRLTLGSVCLESLAEILRSILLTILSILALSLQCGIRMSIVHMTIMDHMIISDIIMDHMIISDIIMDHMIIHDIIAGMDMSYLCINTASYTAQIFSSTNCTNKGFFAFAWK